MLSKLFDGEWRLRAVNHRVAIGTNRNQIRNRINLVFLADSPDWDNVMDMNESLAKRAKYFAKIKSTHGAHMTVMRNASRTSFGISLVSVYRNGESCTFRIFLWR